MKKTNRELERIVKGFANHRRLQILELIGVEPKLSVMEIAQKIKSDPKNVSAHINKMNIAGLVMKRNDVNSIRLKLTKRGKSTLQFVRTLE